MRPLVLFVSLSILSGCPTQPAAPEPDTGPHPIDASAGDGGHDAALVDAGSVDAGMDAGAVDAAGTDAATDDAATIDAGNDAASAVDGGNACVNAGGMCVALVPTSCPGGTVGPESCGGGLGVECCHPAAPSAAPVCMMVGTAQEGWYQPDGTLICVVSCAGLTAMCQRIGTPSQGWYTTTGHGCPPHATEIVHDATCM